MSDPRERRESGRGAKRAGAVARHQPDWLSLWCGLIFLGLGLVYVVSAVLGLRVPAIWALPALLVALGAAGLAGTARRFQRRDDD